jgi:hypothetical protein
MKRMLVLALGLTLTACYSPDAGDLSSNPADHGPEGLEPAGTCTTHGWPRATGLYLQCLGGATDPATQQACADCVCYKAGCYGISNPGSTVGIVTCGGNVDQCSSESDCLAAVNGAPVCAVTQTTATVAPPPPPPP